MSKSVSQPSRIAEAAWDGLSDEEGPIPTFPSRRVDERGRLLPIGDDERAARSDAPARTLRAIQARPDRDPPGIEAEFMRAIDEERPHRPLFQGMY